MSGIEGITIAWGCQGCGRSDAQPSGTTWDGWKKLLRDQGWVLIALKGGRSTGFCSDCVAEDDYNRRKHEGRDDGR